MHRHSDACLHIAIEPTGRTEKKRKRKRERKEGRKEIKNEGKEERKKERHDERGGNEVVVVDVVMC